MVKPEKSLFEKARGGDTRAIEELLVIYQPDIRRYAKKNCASTNYVEDAVQDTLFQLYRKIGSLRHLVAVPRWLFIVVRRMCARLERQFTGGSSIHEEPEIVDFKRSDNDLRIDVSAAIEALPPHYRVVVVLRDFEELSISEIANQLQISREAAKSRIHRARSMIREYLLEDQI